MRNAYYGVIKSYAAAAAYLGKKSDRPLPGRATRLQRRADDMIAVKYHNTDILTYAADESIILNSGGYRTVTTKAKMNEYLPNDKPRVYQNKGVWYIGGNVYADNCAVKPDGIITGVMDTAEAKRQEKLAKQINRYAAAYIAALCKGDVPRPSGGDCWYCFLRHAGNATVGQYIARKGEPGRKPGERTLGEETGGESHLLDHMKDNYYVPSLLARAIELYPVSQAARSILGEVWGQGTPGYWSKQDFVAKQLQNALRRYMRQQLGLSSSQ